MGAAARLKQWMLLGLIFVIALVILLAWIWLPALAAKPFAREAFARAGWAGAPGTVLIAACTVDNYEVGEYQHDTVVCTGSYTPEGGSAPTRTVEVYNTLEKLAVGSTVEVRLLDGLAYPPSWYLFTVNAAIALFFAAVGGIPLALAAMGLYQVWADTDEWSAPGVGLTLLVMIAIGVESGIAVLLDRWALI
jgi:hypothetical protein